MIMKHLWNKKWRGKPPK